MRWKRAPWYALKGSPPQVAEVQGTGFEANHSPRPERAKGQEPVMKRGTVEDVYTMAPHCLRRSIAERAQHEGPLGLAGECGAGHGTFRAIAQRAGSSVAAPARWRGRASCGVVLRNGRRVRRAAVAETPGWMRAGTEQAQPGSRLSRKRISPYPGHAAAAGMPGIGRDPGRQDLTARESTPVLGTYRPWVGSRMATILAAENHRCTRRGWTLSRVSRRVAMEPGVNEA